MARMMSALLGLCFMALCVLGLLGLIPMVNSFPAYYYIIGFLTGALGLLVGTYACPKKNNNRLIKDSLDQLKKENEQWKKEFDQLKKENAIKSETNDQLRKQNEELRKESA